jgi:hypothetical protein
MRLPSRTRQLIVDLRAAWRDDRLPPAGPRLTGYSLDRHRPARYPVARS